MTKVIVIDQTDNVGTAIVDIGKGERVEAGTRSVMAIEDIPFGHKIALAAIANGQVILKYGESIGLAKGSIVEGACVHVHNVDSQRGRGDRGGK